MADVLVAGQPSLLPSGNGKVAVNKEEGGNLRPETIHVLLIDDERLSRLVVGNLLRKCRYRGSFEANTEPLLLPVEFAPGPASNVPC